MDSQQNSQSMDGQNSWSVKSPNQLNLVVNDLNRNAVAASQQTSNLITPVTTPRELTQIMYKRSNKKQQQPGGKASKQHQAGGRSNFFTNNNCLTKVKTRLPPFKQTRNGGGRNMSQTQRPIVRAQEQISNSHLPVHTLNYLQMVDEPGVDKVVSKFGGHHFLNKFRNPLERQTLYHSQVRNTIKDQQPDQSEQQNASFLEPLFDSVLMDEPRVSKTRNTSKRIRSFFTSGNNSVLAENAVNTVRQQTSDRPARNFKFQQQQSHVKRNSIFGSETVVNGTSPRAHESTIVAMQDSIESVINSTNKDQMEAITNNMDAHSKQKVRDFVYFNVSHHNYQPFFKETKTEQDQRKMQIMAKQLTTMEHNSVFSHPSQLHSDSLVQKKKASLEPISAVISSALRVRNRNSIGTRNSSLASRTGNPKPSKDGFSSWHKQSMSVPPQNKVVVNAALTTAQDPCTLEETTEQLQQTQTSQHTQSQTGAEIMPQDCQQRDRTNSLANQMPANLFQSGMTNAAARSIATSPPPLQDLDHSTDMQMYEKKATLLETTTQLLSSTHHSRPESIEPHYNDHPLSLRQSQSASMNEASMLNLPMDGKILAECQTPSNQMHKGKTIEMMANTLTKQNESATQPKNSKVQTGSTKKEQPALDKGKKLVSGSMTMKVSSESTPNGIEIKPQTDNDYTQQSHLDSNLRTKKIVPRQNTLGIQSDQLSVQNLIKINIGSEQSELKTEQKEDVTPNNNENQHLAIIEQPSAQVEIKESMLWVASMRESSSKDPESNRQSNKDLEEFKLAGIISNQFSEQNSNSVRQSIDAKMLAKHVNDPERAKFYEQGLDPVDEQRDTANCEDHTTLSKYLTKDVEQKKDSIHHGVTEIGGDKKSDGVSPRMQVYMSTKQVSVVEDKPDEPGDYVITQYSLPKALTAAGGTRPQKGKFNNNLQRRTATSQQRQYVFNANVKNTSIDESFAVNDSGNEELEQFNFEHGNKQMLVGPMGRKLSKPAASRFQHNLLRRKAIERQNFEQLQQQTLQQNKQQLGSKATQSSITQAAGDQQSVLHHKASSFGQTQLESEMTIITVQGDPVKTFDRSTKDMHHQSMGRTNRSSITKARNASTNMSQNISRLSNDLNAILTPSQRISQMERPKVKVPQLQLNKVELQFAGESKDHMFINSNNQLFQPGTPSYYGNQMTANPPQSSFRLAVFAQNAHQFFINGAENNSRPHQTIGWNQGNNQGMVHGGVSPRTTRMISIDVQTEAHRRELLLQSKLNLNVITQEKSVQDTLYEGNDHLHSQKWIQSGVKLAGAPEFKHNNTADSKDADDCQKQSLQIAQTEGSQIITQNGETSLPKQKESMEENDLVKIGDGAKTISQKALIDKMRLQVGNTVQSSAEEDIKVVDTANLSPHGEGHISVIQSHQTDQEKYLQTFRESLNTANDQENSRRPRRDTEELSPELSPLHKRLLENKYTPSGLEDTLALSSKESSLQQVSTMMQHKKMTTRNKNREISNQDLNIVVKTMPAQLTKDNVPELNNDINKPKDVSKNRRGSVHQQEHDPMYLLDRQKIFSSNKEVNLEQIMKLRYSDDDEESVEGKEKKDNSCDIQTDQQTSLKSNEQSQAVQNMMKKAIISYNSSEYVSLKLQNMVPGEDLEQNQPASTQISIDKTTVYQLQPKLPQVIAEMRQKVINSQYRRNSSQESRYNQNPNCINVRDSMCSQASSTKSPLNKSSIHSMTRTRRASQSPKGLGDTSRNKDEDENWRKLCPDKPERIEKEWQKKYDDKIRKQRLLEQRTKHLNAPKFGRDKTPLMTNNKMLQVPVKPHDRTKVSMLGRNNAKVEEVWAKKQLHNAAYNQN